MQYYYFIITITAIINKLVLSLQRPCYDSQTLEGNQVTNMMHTYNYVMIILNVAPTLAVDGNASKHSTEWPEPVPFAGPSTSSTERIQDR